MKIRHPKEPSSTLLDIEADLRSLSAIGFMAHSLAMGSYGGTKLREMRRKLEMMVSACKQAVRDMQREEFLCVEALQTSVGRRAYIEAHGDLPAMLIESFGTASLSLAEGKASPEEACKRVAVALRRARVVIDKQAEQQGVK